MSRLLLTNVDPDVTDDEIKEFLTKYGFPPCDEVHREKNESSRPGVMVTYEGIDPTALGKLQERIHNLFWRKRTLSAQVLRDHFS
jgi:hypothetical protein